MSSLFLPQEIIFRREVVIPFCDPFSVLFSYGRKETPFFLSHMITKHVKSNGIYPGRHAGFTVKTVQSSVNLKKGFLKQILTGVKIARESEQKVENPVSVFIEYIVKGDCHSVSHGLF